jgi:16S rRNA (cytosine967-C5)-methyltransferase
MTRARPARAAAASTLDRVVRSGAYSNVAVARTPVEPASDHGRYQMLVYSCLRHLPSVDAAIDAANRRPRKDVDPIVMSILRVGTAELLVLDGDPWAVVDDAVEATRVLGVPRASGFVNGVLRSIAKSSPRIPDGPEAAYPGPLVESLTRALGRDDAEAFLTASNAPAPVGLRFRDGSHGDAVIPGTAYADPDAAGPLIAEGVADVIDPASAAVAVAVDATPGQHIADLAAAPGGKTRALADAVGADGLVVAADIHARRVKDAARRSSSVRQITWLVQDGRLPALRDGAFDAVLLDAPCTGLGTLRRRPEIRFRVEPDAPATYGAVQRELLERAIELAAPGGRVVYSVCTVFPAETTDVVAGLGFAPPAGLPGDVRGDGLLLAPHLTGTDGMFIAVRSA